MNNLLNTAINEQVQEIFTKNRDTIESALINGLSVPGIDEDLFQLVLNAIRVSLVYSVQLTIENLMSLGVVQIDDDDLRQALFEYRSNP